MKHDTTIQTANSSRKLWLRPRPLAVFIAGSLAMLAAQGVAAQQATKADGTDAEQLEVIVVTANKRKENVRKVPSSISVLNDAQLERINATQLTDYAKYIPGFQVSSNGSPGKTTVSMRGIAPLSSGSTIGTYIDETPLGSSGIYQAATNFALDLLPYDIERIEVLRGPQGTLYGAGSMGGLLKYVTRQPDLNNVELRAGGGLSSVSGGGTGNNVRFGANVPLIEDALAIRASYSRNNLPGFIDNTINGKKDINDGSQTSGRIAMLWKVDDFSVNVAAMRQSIDVANNNSVALRTDAEKPLYGDLKNDVYVNEPFKKDINYYSATLNWELGWGSFTSASGYSDTTTRQRGDTTIAYGRFADLALGLPAAGSSPFDVGLDLTKFTQEFRLASNSEGVFEWLVGAFYTRESGNQTQAIFLNQLNGTPFPPPAPAAFGTLASLELPSTYKEKALFGNATYKFTDRFKVTAGLRYASNDQKFSQNVLSGVLLPIGQQPGSSSENIFTYSLAPQFQLTDDNLLYAKVASGYQPGGPNVSFPGLPPKVDSSKLTSYELGLKALFADRRVQVDLAAFRIDWKNIQVPTVFEGKSGLVNGGKATTQGLELSTLYRPDASLQLGFNAAYTKAALSDDYKTILLAAGGGNTLQLTGGLSGDRLPYVPRFSASITGDYFFPLGSWEGNVGGGLSWRGSRVAGTTERRVTVTPTGAVVTTAFRPPNSLDSYRSLDLYAGAAKDQWSIRGYVKNATNERGYLSIANDLNQVTGVTGSRSATPILPRTVGVEVDYRF